MLENKKNVEQAIAVVCQAVKLFKGYFPRDTQLISIWLFLNPEINRNEGKIGKIATGEGKSIIVAAIAAIKALNCERVDAVKRVPWTLSMAKQAVSSATSCSPNSIETIRSSTLLARE